MPDLRECLEAQLQADADEPVSVPITTYRSYKHNQCMQASSSTISHAQFKLGIGGKEVKLPLGLDTFIFFVQSIP
jgi:hypothetical protein